MVDEKEGHYEGQEEEEYHFSDDQANYEMEGETTKVVEPEKLKMPIMQQLSQRKIIVLGVIGGIVLIALIYKLIKPESVAPVTEFNQAAANRPIAAPPKHMPAPSAPSLNAEMTTMQQQAEKMPVTVTTGITQQLLPVSTGSPQSVPQSAPSQMMSTGTPPPVMIAQPSSSPPTILEDKAQNKVIMDRLATLEQQNAALMNLLQTEYAQKISDNETQTTMMRGKLTELTKRINRIEATLTQLTQLMQGNSNGQLDSLAPAAPEGSIVTAAPVPKMTEPKMSYTVQAIIPGRAWLKSESGDTVTVAEGDVLKDYGRVVKIDPYDGIVNIDTGTKVITLSYGVGGG